MNRSAVCGFLASHWELVDFGEPLHLLNSSLWGRNLWTPAGAVDFLCRAEPSGDLVGVVCVDGEVVDEVRAALKPRLEWVRQHLAQPGQRVRGIVVASDRRLRLDGLAEGDVEVRRLHVTCVAELPSGAAPAAEPAGREFDLWDIPGTLPPATILPPEPTPGPVAPPPATSPGPQTLTADFATKCLQVPRGGRNGVPRRPLP